MRILCHFYNAHRDESSMKKMETVTLTQTTHYGNEFLSRMTKDSIKRKYDIECNCVQHERLSRPVGSYHILL